MRIIFLFIALTLMSCGKKEDNWKSPSLYLLRTEKNQIVAGNDHLDLNDYIYFSDTGKNPNSEDLKNISAEYLVKAEASCITNGTTFKFNKAVSRNYIQLKDFLPIEAILSTPSTLCKMTITLQNSSGSTKSYLIPEKIIELTNYKEDFKVASLISYQEFDKQKITSSNQKVDLICDLLTSESHVQADSITFDDLLKSSHQVVRDIDVKQYKPSQHCRIALRSSDRTQLSNQFEMCFEKLIPNYSYDIWTLNKAKRSGAIVFLYDLKLSNHNEVPVSIGIRKSALNVPLIKSQHYGHENSGEMLSPMNGVARLSISEPKLLIDKGDIIVIHLQPNESVSIQALVDTATSCNATKCVYSAVSIKNLPIYNLEYNYRSFEEIQKAVNIKVSDQLIAN